VPYQPALDRPGGIVAGYVFMAAADVAMWLAILTKLGTKENMAVTAEMKTAFLRAARGEDFRCRATVLKFGKRLVYGVAACLGARGVLTHHTMTYLRS
jgi:acyl-coenzyme A thioesterase PaaI-like protein